MKRAKKICHHYQKFQSLLDWHDAFQHNESWIQCQSLSDCQLALPSFNSAIRELELKKNYPENWKESRVGGWEEARKRKHSPAVLGLHPQVAIQRWKLASRRAQPRQPVCWWNTRDPIRFPLLSLVVICLPHWFPGAAFSVQSLCKPLSLPPTNQPIQRSRNCTVLLPGFSRPGTFHVCALESPHSLGTSPSQRGPGKGIPCGEKSHMEQHWVVRNEWGDHFHMWLSQASSSLHWWLLCGRSPSQTGRRLPRRLVSLQNPERQGWITLKLSKFGVLSYTPFTNRSNPLIVLKLSG